jgi:dGTPase
MALRYERRIAVPDEDHRPDQRRDRDRVMFTAAVQRLAGVTQVASALEGFAFHNRLTHTLEMAQIGRRLAEKLLSENEPETILALGDIDPDIVEAACLAHDTGHPPFGHTAESELDSLLRSNGDLEGFEGNAQSLRIVTTLEPYRPSFLGLNLTRATLNALLKYPWLRPADSSDKWGAYESDEATLQWARDGIQPGRARSSEADLVDIADDIAYSVHDMHDFFRCDFIPLETLCRGANEFDNFLARAFSNWTKVPEPVAAKSRADISKAFRDFISTHCQVEGRYSGTYSQRAQLRETTSLLIKRFRDSVFVDKSRALPHIAMRPEAELEIRLLRELTSVYVHGNSALYMQRLGHRKAIRFLFETFSEHASRGDFRLFPLQYRELLESSDKLATFCSRSPNPQVRVVVDMICSLTDNQALLIFQRLSGMHPGHVLDQMTS